jgi:hypothetical protein
METTAKDGPTYILEESKDPPPTTLDEILAERGARYGRFVDHARVTMRLKNVISDELDRRGIEIDHDMTECLHMVCHKIGRIIAGDPEYVDSWRDIAGYATLVADRLEGNAR